MFDKNKIAEPSLEMGEIRDGFNFLFDASPKDKKKFNPEYISELMQGMIDFHVHGGPDSGSIRVYNDDVIALDACRAGLQAVVFKSHAVPTYIRAPFIKKEVDRWAKENGRKTLDIFGGVTLNYSVGGLNPTAVKTCIDLGGKFVWTPSVNASHHHRVVGKPGGIEVLDENGKVVPELLTIFEMVRDNGLILGLSHHSVYERFVLIETAKKMGLDKIVVNHPLGGVNYTLPEQIAQMAQMGAYIQITYTTSIPTIYKPKSNLAAMLKVFELVGFDRIVGASELSQLGAPPPSVGLTCFIGILLALGVTESNIKKMFVSTPSSLLYN